MCVKKFLLALSIFPHVCVCFGHISQPPPHHADALKGSIFLLFGPINLIAYYMAIRPTAIYIYVLRETTHFMEVVLGKKTF